MDSTLTKPASQEELYRTYFSFANKFEFTTLLRNYIQNEEWKETTQENVWKLLSSVSDDIGAVLTDDIVNYTRNVVDINTCKVPQLIEQSRMLAYSLDGIKNSYAYFPKRIQALVDIFSVNSEYLIGNGKNHILSDKVIKEILIYIRDNSIDVTPFTNDNVLDKLIDNPHELLQKTNYRNFVQLIFFNSIKDALSAAYSTDEHSEFYGVPMAFNVFWEELKNQASVSSNIDTYRSWVDKYISNEIEHPWNQEGWANTIYDSVQTVKAQKQMSSKFNPFKVADEIYLYGLNPTNSLTQDELDLVETVIDYHSKTKYDYANEQFVDNASTKYAYYKELEFIDNIKLVMFIMNNIKSFDITNISYDISANKFIQIDISDNESVRVMQLFNQNGTVVKLENGKIALNYAMLLKVSKFLCDYVFYIQSIRENIKTIAQKHAMRGSGALIVHLVNDYLIKELPVVRDLMLQDKSDTIPFGWELDTRYYNYGNVNIVEYMDDNEYFNIDPYNDSVSEQTNERYWEQLEEMGDDDSLGVLTKGQIRDFYRETLGMGRLQQSQPKRYDDVADFLVDLFKTGANPIEYDSDNQELSNPLDDIINRSEQDYGYTKAERLEVQQNTDLRQNQEDQFYEYSGMMTLPGQKRYDYDNSKIFYWKNTQYSSHMLHPFMYNLKLWNRLNNIIINGYKDYVNNDLIDYLSSRIKFDDIFGEYGEGKNFWKYNIMDFTGYTTRYEAAVKNEYREDEFQTLSPITGYDGLFYPDAAEDFIYIYGESSDFTLNTEYINDEELWKAEAKHGEDGETQDKFNRAIYSIYWQTDKNGSEDSFYAKWYSHLNYTKLEYQKIAMQLWYWRDRIYEFITTNYPIHKYCLDIQGNSLILVQSFKDGEENTNPYLVDLLVAQNRVEQEINENKNTHVSTCSNKLKKPAELWIRWKSNPIAIPAFDVLYNQKTGDTWFDLVYRTTSSTEFGQLTHSNNDCNDNFKVVIEDWTDKYGTLISDNRLPVFFDMEQSANIVILSSWAKSFWDTGMIGTDQKPIYFPHCAKNPIHIVSIERPSENISEYKWTEYSDNDTINDAMFDENPSSETYHKGWLFDSYYYCQASGAILIPSYRFVCSDDDDDEISQTLKLKLMVIPAQQLKKSNFDANHQIIKLNQFDVNLNQKMSFTDTLNKYRFDYPIKVCKNTNLVFSTYDDDGLNKVKCAFLGNFIDGNNEDNFKVNSCEAKTRYEQDSRSTLDIGLLKNGYYKDNGSNNISYIDKNISETAFNSYDLLDKYILSLDFVPTIDNKTLFDNAIESDIVATSYNILGDAGYIPHFAYQSLIGKFGDDDGGTSYTWKNQHLKDKDHLSFELLGLDDKSIPEAYKVMNKMVVDDLTDDCKTLLCPSRLMENIYRIWCEPKDVDHSYFPNEYVEYSNPELTFESEEWDEYIDWEVTDNLFQIDLPASLDTESMSEDELIEAYKEVLNDYYVSVLRTSDGNILNEKRYILPPTSLAQFFEGVNPETFNYQSDATRSGFVSCNLNDWSSARITDNRFVSTQVIFVGTRNPFKFTNNGTKVYTKDEELQYGNGICGVREMALKVDVCNDGGNKFLKPTLRLYKFSSTSSDLVDKIQTNTHIIDEGDITIIFSHRNLDNIAKYHIMNFSSDLYFQGSLSKDEYDRISVKDTSGEVLKLKENHFKFSDFKYSQTVKLVENPKGTWTSDETDEDGNSILTFTKNEVLSQDGGIPPYYLGTTDTPTWFLEQDKLVPSRNLQEFHQGILTPLVYIYDIPTIGSFKWAHKVKAKAESYLDYLYLKNGGLKFKINEESYSLFDAMQSIPPFHIDEVLKNKMTDLNDVQIQSEYSTFIHESENPESVYNCANFNPLMVKARLDYGLLEQSSTVYDGVVINTSGDNSKTIELNNFSNSTNLQLQLEDGELNDLLKIYTNYVKVPDGEDGDYHYDLYFNIQNLFNSPFEYISSVTNQPNVLILKDSYLYLSGDKYTYDSDSKSYKIDEDKVEKIKQGGTLTIYGQVKSYSNETLSDVQTIKLFQYQVYNISDDKPKFLINKIYDITKSRLTSTVEQTIKIEFQDVLWTLKDAQLKEDNNPTGISTHTKVLNQDVTVIQPLRISYNWNQDDDNRINSIEFEIQNDVIDFGAVPELWGRDKQVWALKQTQYLTHYDRWSDNYMKLEKVQRSDGRNVYKMTLTYDEDCGFNFETIYLRWKLPENFNVMDTTDRLRGYSFSTTASNIVVNKVNESTKVNVEVTKGHIVNRVVQPGTMYLGLEHSTTQRKNGYVITGLADQIRQAIAASLGSTTLGRETESNIKNYSKKVMENS